MTTYLVTIGILFCLLAGTILVERLYRRFAARNPQLGPFRSHDGCSCCKNSCSSAGGSCQS